VRVKSPFDDLIGAMSMVDPETGAPQLAIGSKRRLLIELRSEHGTPEALWVAPRRGGERLPATGGDAVVADGDRRRPAFEGGRHREITPAQHSSWPFAAKMEKRGGKAGLGLIVAAGRGKKRPKTSECHWRERQTVRVRPARSERRCR
jgi:hypothetical protein